MVATWGSGNGESDDEVDETTFMTLGKSDTEDDDNFEVSITDPKEKLQSFSKNRLIGLMNGLIDDLEELKYERDKLFKAFADQKFENMEFKAKL